MLERNISIEGFDDTLIHENLVEHVGSLPIIASFIHPYMEEKVNLGKVLTMLSIHDIGELTAGDKMTFTKKDSDREEEAQQALKILHPVYHNLYIELEERETNEAKYANSIDKISPDLYDYICGAEFTKVRLQTQVGWEKEEVLKKIRQKKRPHMEWSKTLTGIHDALFENFR